MMKEHVEDAIDLQKYWEHEVAKEERFLKDLKVDSSSVSSNTDTVKSNSVGSEDAGSEPDRGTEEYEDEKEEDEESAATAPQPNSRCPKNGEKIVGAEKPRQLVTAAINLNERKKAVALLTGVSKGREQAGAGSTNNPPVAIPQQKAGAQYGTLANAARDPQLSAQLEATLAGAKRELLMIKRKVAAENNIKRR